jgi:prepilin-type processing-associated H-X9-DG protein
MQVVLTNSETLKLVTNGNAYLFWQIMSNELSTPKILHCPADERRTNALSFTQGFSDANISYFFNLDALTIYPQMIVDGDDNLAVDGVPVKPGVLIPRPNRTLSWTDERHPRIGNIGMADGSVQQVTSNGLNTVFAERFCVSTNITSSRWVIP